MNFRQHLLLHSLLAYKLLRCYYILSVLLLVYFIVYAIELLLCYFALFGCGLNAVGNSIQRRRLTVSIDFSFQWNLAKGRRLDDKNVISPISGENRTLKFKLNVSYSETNEKITAIVKWDEFFILTGDKWEETNTGVNKMRLNLDPCCLMDSKWTHCFSNDQRHNKSKRYAYDFSNREYESAWNGAMATIHLIHTIKMCHLLLVHEFFFIFFTMSKRAYSSRICCENRATHFNPKTKQFLI